MEILEALKKQRQAEIKKGDNACTSYPIYIVYDQIFTVSDPDDLYDQCTTVFDDSPTYVRFDDDGNEKKAEEDISSWGESKGKWRPVVKKSFHDRFITLCFTRKAANAFIKAERHNLNKPRIYVDHVLRRNLETRGILNILGDK